MAYQATVIPVMIASPGDVVEERELIRRVIHDWNDVNAESTHAILTAVGWDTHSSPEIGTRAQELINSRILKNCDLLIGVFWTRLGTPTGDFSSGTVEEIDNHIKAGKPAMIYFSSKPAAPESINADQYEKVKQFRDLLKSKGLIETFDTPEELERKFSKQLQVSLAKNPYLRGLIGTHSTLGLVGIPSVGSTSISIENKLTNEAKKILKLSSKYQDGLILKVSYIGGKTIQVGGEQLGGDSGRESAKWESALDELMSSGLVVERGHKGQVFELTHKGWEVADKI